MGINNHDFSGFPVGAHGTNGEGVLLLNTVLTVHEGRANSHKDFGWERVTDAAIRAVSREREGAP